MELVDVPDSKSGAARRGGSSPPRGTTQKKIFFEDPPNQNQTPGCGRLNLVRLGFVRHGLLNNFFGERWREEFNEGVNK